MDRVTARQLRALRGVVASAITVLLAATAHTVAGGGAPAPLLLVAAAMLAAPPAVLLVGRRPSVLRTSTAVLAAQAVFHGVFALFGGPSTVTFVTPVGAHVHSAQMVATGTHAMTPHSMSAAHVIAALVTVVVLHRGEWMLRAAGRGIHRLLPLRRARVPRPSSVRAVRATFAAPALRAVLLVCSVGRRGPPALV
ncbi:hypothetical protein ET475_00780 [Microbacterium protaetiae]|uniref:Uncharacterized protein n=1 Tax=Microbacterium protaetiae TaxID=2509458 RepID=A0A4P6E9B5_9MICO|nr:hypothetical protein [Microbacterium protaetiae]QAY58680.1 hypothetical protein ET475_00780 [Microbacterium protaetiae]